jgi:2-C-methyl-D-erythritol 4-phosphate cytidylyltransferase
MVWAIVLAAGRGARFGGRAKQFELLGGRPVLSWALDVATEVADGVVLVVPPGANTGAHPSSADRAVVEGGETRSASVRHGLAEVPPEADVIVVHDAARPLAPASLFAEVVGAVRAGADAAVPGLPVADTVKRISDGVVVETLDRTELVAVQTPQAFAGPVLRAAHDDEPDATDDAALVERSGGRVVVVAGDERAAKITVPADLVRLEGMFR